jgi:hypothetical protein
VYLFPYTDAKVICLPNRPMALTCITPFSRAISLRRIRAVVFPMVTHPVEPSHVTASC